MKVNVREVKTLKTGENEYGPWALVKIITNDDVEYTTLAEGATAIQPGMVVDISNMNEDGQGRKNFKKFEIFAGEGAPPIPQPAPTATETNVEPPQPPKQGYNADGAARGMLVKEMGDMVRAGKLSEIFGPKIASTLITWYRCEVLGISRIEHDGKDLPKFGS
ncbi:hypothetical protein LCGC14_1145890 [marine sediment metagenome]|uniref:Uncharacterized protein n=1 Tax=marine sediment metagenome TaxID=412755 RepID=A0A0F9PF19_9ZZZZ